MAEKAALVSVVRSDGTPGTVPQNKLAIALGSGYKLAGAQGQEGETQDSGLFSDLSGTVAQGAMSALDTAGFGLGTAAAKDIIHGAGALGIIPKESKEQVRGELTKMREEHPYAEFAGSVGGSFLNPVFGKAGAAAEGLVAGGKGAGVARTLAGKFAAGTAEMSAFNTAQGIADDVLKDEDLTAEKIFAHAMDPSALLGGVLHMGGSAVGMGAKGTYARVRGFAKGLSGAEEVMAKAADSSEKAQFLLQGSGMSSEQASQAVADATAAGVDSFAPGEALGKKVAQKLRSAFVDRVEGAEAKEGAGIVYDHGKNAAEVMAKEKTALSGEMRQSITENIKDNGFMDSVNYGEKPQQIRALVDESRLASQFDEVNRISASIKESAAEMESRFADPKQVKKISKHAKFIDDNIGAAARLTAEGDTREASARLFEAINDTKKALGKDAKFGKSIYGIGPAGQAADSLYLEHLLPSLERGDIWGDSVASFQKETNAAFSGNFTGRKAFDSSFSEKVGEVRGRPKSEAHSTNIDDLFHKFENSDAAASDIELIQQHTDGTKSRASSLLRTASLTDDQAAHLKGVIERANKTQAILDKAKDRSKVWTATKAILSTGAEGGTSGMTSTILGGAIGAAMGSMGLGIGAGKIVGGSIDMLMNPAKAVRTMGGIRQAFRQVSDGIDSAAKRVSKKGLSEEVVAPMSHDMTVKTIDEVKKISQSPGIQAALAKRVSADYADASPTLAAAVVTTLVRAVGYLRDNTPVPYPRSVFDSDDKDKYSDKEVDAFGYKFQGATNPVGLAHNVANRTASAAQVDAVKNVYPKIYEEMRVTFMRQLAEDKKRGLLRDVDYDSWRQIATMLGVPIDKTMEGGFVARMQDSAMSDPNAQGAIGASAAQGGQSKRAIKPDTKNMETASERIERL